MELKRLLTRATALLLQGAYQGAESLIEQAMAEADKLKQELAELDTLRTRVTEMAAEVERLQSAIDEANAQDPCFEVGRHGKSGDYFVTELKSNVKLYKGMRLFARPIPAQQSPAVSVPETISDQLENFICYLIDKEEGAIIAEETLHHQLAAFLLNEKYNKPSPRITEQDAREIIEDYIGFCDGKRLKPQSSTVIGMYMKNEFSALLNKLNGDHNGK